MKLFTNFINIFRSKTQQSGIRGENRKSRSDRSSSPDKNAACANRLKSSRRLFCF